MSLLTGFIEHGRPTALTVLALSLQLPKRCRTDSSTSLKTAKHGPIFLACCHAACFPSPLCFWLAFRVRSELPKRLEKCLPYPTLAQEIREMRPAPAQLRVHVIRVDFDSNDGIPADARDEISAELRSHVFEPDADSAYLKDLANEIAEVGVRLRDRGYFKATAIAKLTTLQTEGADMSVVVAISATPPCQHLLDSFSTLN